MAAAPKSASRCKVMDLGRTDKQNIYYMGNQKLEVVNEEKDLRILLTVDLKPSRQCQQAYSNASKVLGMIGRIIAYKDRNVLLWLYKSLVRPHLEYCSAVLSGHHTTQRTNSYLKQYSTLRCISLAGAADNIMCRPSAGNLL